MIKTEENISFQFQMSSFRYFLTKGPYLSPPTMHRSALLPLKKVHPELQKMTNTTTVGCNSNFN
jgi:hypothetical protein